MGEVIRADGKIMRLVPTSRPGRLVEGEGRERPLRVRIGIGVAIVAVLMLVRLVADAVGIR